MQIRRLVYAVLVLLVSSLPGIAGARSSDSACPDALQDYQVALKSYQDGFFDPAFAGFEAYLLQCPLGQYVGQAHYLLAEMLAQQTKCDKALPHVKEALSHPLDPSLRPHVSFLGARCALQSKQPDLAQTYLQASVSAEAPVEIKAPAWYWLGELAFQKRLYDEAKRYYALSLQEASEGDYAAHAHYSLGFIAQEEGDIDAALRAFDAFLKLAPAHRLAARVQFTQADLWRQNGQLKEAAAAFKALSQTLSGTMQEESLFRWAELAYALKDDAAAQAAYQRLIQAFPQSQRLAASLYGLGWSALRQDQCQAAIAPWEQLLARPSTGVTEGQIREVHYHLGLCYMERQDHARARAHLRQVIVAGEDTMEQREAVIKAAALAYQGGDYDEAIELYRRALVRAENPQARQFHFLLGESYRAKGEMEQAVTHWQEALKGSPDLPFYAVALSRLGHAYAAAHDWQQAIPVLRRLWDNFPDFPDRLNVAVELAQAYRQSNDCEAALPFYDFLGSSDPGRAALHNLRYSHAACLFATAHYQDVIALLKPLLGPEQTDATDPTLLYTLGQAYMELQQFEASISPLTRLQTEFPDHPLSRAMIPRLAYAFEQTGRPGDALDTWQSYLQSGTEADGSERLRLQVHMGRLALLAKRFEEALTWLPEASEISDHAMAVEALFWRSEAYYALQQWEAAKEQYQKVIDYRRAGHWGEAAQLRLATVYEQQQEWDLALATYRTLRDSATDAEIIASAERRIAAIEAGLTRSRPQAPSPPGNIPGSSKG